MIPFAIDNTLLDELTLQAKASDRKRMHYDLRDNEDEDSMRMLNAIEPSSVIPVHRHTMTSEDVVVLRGCVEEVLYEIDSNSNLDTNADSNSKESVREVARVRLEAGTSCVACHVPKGMYHTCISLQSGSVIIEFKATRYDPENSEEVL